MYNIPNYSPAHNPFKPPSKPMEEQPIPDSTKLRAKGQGCQYISKDGKRGYMWRYDKMYEAFAPDFASWTSVTGPELPAGELIELP